jgi:hypothetical protein
MFFDASVRDSSTPEVSLSFSDTDAEEEAGVSEETLRKWEEWAESLPDDEGSDEDGE